MTSARQDLPPHGVRARNGATASDNKIHDDAVARQHGFLGGLVPGITVFGYLVTPVVEAWGEAWLERGFLSARFRHPIYDGDELTVAGTVEAAGDLLTAAVEARNRRDEVCALGAARLEPDAPAPPSIEAYPAVDPFAPRLSATPEALGGVEALGSVEAGFHADRIDETEALLGGNLPICRRLRVAHPVWLLYFANALLASNVALGPWIHTASAVQNLGLVRDGERVSARGRVAGLRERRGHRLVDLDVLLVAEGRRPVMHVRHSAIYALRSTEHPQ